MGFAEEIREKERRVRELMRRERLGALAITNVGNFAWLTCGGGNYVGTANDVGAATAVITADAKYIVCDNIERPRIRDEEVHGQGFEFWEYGWQENNRDAIIAKIANGVEIGSDIPMAGARNAGAALDACRQSLTAEEIQRYRKLGKAAAECLEATAREIRPGMTEHEMAGMLDKRLYSRGIVPTLTLIATDERIDNYRHPVPTEKKLERRAMLVTGARKWGLIVSATRMVSFGEAPEELRRRHDAVARADATLISATRPGARMGDVFRGAMAAYSDTGYPGEWKLHHQGGPTGYRPREFRVTEATDAIVVDNQAFAWNPSITGAKTEDTIVATAEGPIVLSGTDDWPKVNVEIEGQVIARPDILVL